MKRKESLDVQRKRRWIRELDGCDLLECELEITFYIPRDDCSMCNLLYEWSICHEKNENKRIEAGMVITIHIARHDLLSDLHQYLHRIPQNHFR